MLSSLKAYRPACIGRKRSAQGHRQLSARDCLLAELTYANVGAWRRRRACETTVAGRQNLSVASLCCSWDLSLQTNIPVCEQQTKLLFWVATKPQRIVFSHMLVGARAAEKQSTADRI